MAVAALRRRWLAVVLALVLVLTTVIAGEVNASVDDRRWLDRSLSPESRARALVSAMTVEEKSAMLWSSGRKVVGDETWQVHVKGNDRLGVPDLTMADGSTGLRGGTQMPAPIALGASFSRADATAYGDVIGRETRAMGYGVLLAPTVNLARDPRHGRTFEAFGEDPYLMGQLAVPETKAIQRHRVLADLKHLAVNNIERDRETTDVEIDERTLHELYLPHFRDVVVDGQAASVMCSFNKINGVHACDDEGLLERLLRDRWGFDGFVRTDANAYHAVTSVGHGLEQELPKEIVYKEELVAAVRNGTIDEAVLDRAAFRVLRAMFALGVYDDPPERTGVDVAAGAADSQRLAENSTVLLRNERNLLPLDPNTSRLAVIGGDAATTGTYGGGSSNIKPARKDTILDGIRNRVPGATVEFASGVDPISPVAVQPGYDVTPSAVLRTADGGSAGLTADYFRRADFTSRIERRTDRCVCFDDGWYADGGTVLPKPPGRPQSVRWSGTITAPGDGVYGFDLSGYDSVRLYLDDQLVIDHSGTHDATPKAAKVTLRAGEARKLRIEMVIEAGNPHVEVSRKLKFGWQPPAGVVDPAVAAAAAAAARAEVAVVVVRDYQSEATDRGDLRLPNGQDALVRAVAAANPNTVVVLTTGSAVAMPWADEVPVIVEAWYGGTSAGAALARVLFGDVAPSGRLPISFPVSAADLPTGSPEQFPGVNQLTRYTEGLRVGYRHFESAGAAAPAYPFGFGLSYTTFAYSDLSLDRDTFTAQAAGRDATLHGHRGVTATFTVRNTGERAGAVVPQVYVRSPDNANLPSRQLKGFDKVMLAPGESRRISVKLDQQAFAVYEPAADQWLAPAGNYQVQVGDSSRDIRLRQQVRIAATAGAPRVELTAPALVTPGEQFTVRGRVVNDGSYRATGLSGRLAVPPGWTVDGGALPADGVAAGAAVATSWRVTPPVNANPDDYRLAATLHFRAGPSVAQSLTDTTVHVPHSSLKAAFNNVGVTADDAVTTGDLDGKQHTLSATALADKGYTPGAAVQAGGATFTWPDVGPGQADNVATYGQAVRLSGRGEKVALLATSNSAASAGWVTLIYADGTSSRTLVRAADWWANSPAPGSSVATTLPYVNTAQPLCAGGTLDGTKCHHDVSLYVLTVPADPAKELTGMVLPTLSPSPAGPIATTHVFAVSVS